MSETALIHFQRPHTPLPNKAECGQYVRDTGTPTHDIEKVTCPRCVMLSEDLAWIQRMEREGARETPVGTLPAPVSGETLEIIKTPVPIYQASYRNHEGKVSTRRFRPLELAYRAAPPWYPSPRLLLRAWDEDKQAERFFDLARFETAIRREFEVTAYLAAHFQNQDVCRDVLKPALERAGVKVIARWLDEPEPQKGPDGYPVQPPDFQAQCSKICREDIREADALVIYNPAGMEKQGTGGRLTEFGIALERELPVAVLGIRSNVFFHDPDSEIHDWWAPGPDALREVRKKGEILPSLENAALQIAEALSRCLETGEAP